MKDGCLLDAFDRGGVDVIMHCANLQNVFGSGVAKSIKERYPAAYEADTEHHTKNRKSPISYAGFAGYNRAIVNLYGQEFYGRDKRHLNYGRLAEALIEARSCVYTLKTKIGIPYNMGCDRAGGDFNIVLEMVEYIFRENEVYVYKL